MNNKGLVRPLMPPQVNFHFFLPVTVPPKQGLIHRLRDIALADDANPLGKALSPFTQCFFLQRRRGLPQPTHIFSPKTHGPAINFTLKVRYGCPSSQNDTQSLRSVSSTDAPLTAAYLPTISLVSAKKQEGRCYIPAIIP